MPNQSFLSACFGVATLRVTLCLLAVVALAAADEKPPLPRKHSDGPLTAADFQAKPDPRSRFAAWTEIDFDYSYKYRFERNNGRVVMRLIEVDVWSRLQRERSWTRRPRDPLVLDHEQGHFDLMETFAQAARIQLQTLIKASSPQIVAAAPTEAEARDALREKLRAQLQPFTTEGRTANETYDRETENGTDVAAQAAARQQQRARLEELAAQWDKLTK
jgi:hypothetical protein